MTIYADKKDGKPTGRWMVEVTVAGRQRQRKRFDSMAEAKAAEARWKAGHVDDLPAALEATPDLTLRDLADEAIPILWQRNAERQADANSKVRVIIDWVGNPPIKDIDFRWLANLSLILTEQGRALATINRYLTCLHSLLAYAFEAKHITEMPSFKRLWQDEDEGRIRWLTAEEEHKLLSFLEEVGFGHVRDFVTVAIDTGCRRGELLHAQPSWVQNGVLHLPAPKTKTRKNRSIPLTARAKRILEHALPWAIGRNHLRYAWLKAQKHMGLENDENFVLHCCRHTCATRLAMSGRVNLVAIKEWLGHASIKTTARYAHVTPDMLQAAVGVLEQMYATPSATPHTYPHLATPFATPAATRVGERPSAPVEERPSFERVWSTHQIL